MDHPRLLSQSHRRNTKSSYRSNHPLSLGRRRRACRQLLMESTI